MTGGAKTRRKEILLFCTVLSPIFDHCFDRATNANGDLGPGTVLSATLSDE